MWKLKIYVTHDDGSFSEEADGKVGDVMVMPQIGDTVIFDDVEYVVKSRIIDIFNREITINA